MVDLTVVAIPMYLLGMGAEAVSYRFLPDRTEQGYRGRDTATSIGMGLGSLVAGLLWGALTIAAYTAVAKIALWEIQAVWWTWIVLFVLDDLRFYFGHRMEHRVRILWASHVNHHSSRHFNLSTALRQTWTGIGTMPLALPLVLLGFPPAMLLTVHGINLLYQFWLHIERVGKLWRPVELVMNTPSHHRVHHGSNGTYLDKNYGGVFIAWDRIFGTFEAEKEAVVYGLTRNIDTHNLFRVAFHEYAAIGRDLRATPGLRDRLGILFRSPGWSYETLHAADKART